MDEQSIELVNTKKELEWVSLKKERDMAHLDYNLIFNEVVNICPGMNSIITIIKNVKPAQFGEIDFLLKQLNNDKTALRARQRLFDINLRVAVKNALQFYKKYGVNIEDAFQEACVGIWISIDKYDKNGNTRFQTYASTCMYRTMFRNLFICQYNARLPTQVESKVLAVIYKNTVNSVDDWKVLSWNELLLCLKTNLKSKEEDVKKICGVLFPAESIETVLDDNTCSDFGKTIEDIDNFLLERSINGAFLYLKDKEKNIIKMRYGFDDGVEMTLQEVGNVFHVSRERVRQIELNAIKIIKWYIQSNRLFENIYPDIPENELCSPLEDGFENEKKRRILKEKMCSQLNKEFKKKRTQKSIEKKMFLKTIVKSNNKVECKFVEEKVCLQPKNESKRNDEHDNIREWLNEINDEEELYLQQKNDIYKKKRLHFAYLC